MRKRIDLCRLLVASCLVLTLGNARADDSILPDPAQRLVNNSIVAMGFIDLHQVDAIADVLGIDPSLLTQAKSFVGDLSEKFGIQIHRVYWLHNVEDYAAIPTIIVPLNTENESQRQMVAKFARRNQLFRLDDQRFHPITHGIWITDAFVFGTKRAITNLKAVRPTRRKDLIDRLQRLRNAKFALVVSPGPDTRRVLRESFPVMPSPFHTIDGDLLAHQVKSVSVAVAPNAEPRFEVRVATASPETAALVEKAITDAIAMSKTQDAPTKPLFRTLRRTIAPIDALEKRCTDSSFSMRIANDALAQRFRKLTSTAIFDIVAGKRNAQRLNDVRQLLLAILNYESAQGEFPAAANMDANGQPLLSWRVHVLPYLGETDLYKEFELTQSWDSPHNRKLIDRMPLVFQPGTIPGHACLLGVAGEGCFLDGSVPRKLKAFRDGISKTVGLVHVNDESSVIWTKPGDWEPDLTDPYEGLAIDHEGRTAIGFLDARSMRIRNGFNPGMFKTTLTIDGGETTSLDGF